MATGKLNPDDLLDFRASGGYDPENSDQTDMPDPEDGDSESDFEEAVKNQGESIEIAGSERKDECFTLLVVGLDESERLTDTIIVATFNVHASILPFLGGSAPINWAIINGFTKTGLTSFLLNDKIDTGNIILNKECDIEETDDFKSLFLKLSDMCVKFTENTVLKLLKLRLNNDSFDSSLMYNPYDIFASNVKRFICYKDITPFIAPKLTALNTRISWKDSASNIHNFVRGLSPMPGAHTTISVYHSSSKKEKLFNVKILETEVLSSDVLPNNSIPADNLSNIYTDKKKCLYFIDTFPLTNEILSIKKIQLENKKIMDIKSFLNGFRGFEKESSEDCLTIKFV